MGAETETEVESKESADTKKKLEQTTTTQAEATKNSVDEHTASSIKDKKTVNLDNVEEFFDDVEEQKEMETLTHVKTKADLYVKKEEKTATTASVIQHSVSAPTVSATKEKKIVNLDDVKDAETVTEAESKETVIVEKEETKADIPF